MRGSHRGPLMPVKFSEANPSRFDGPPRVISAGFQIANGELIGPRDLFDDPSFDRARQRANEIADFLRAHGLLEEQMRLLKSAIYGRKSEQYSKEEGIQACLFNEAETVVETSPESEKTEEITVAAHKRVKGGLTRHVWMVDNHAGSKLYWLYCL